MLRALADTFGVATGILSLLTFVVCALVLSGLIILGLLFLFGFIV